MSEDTFDKQALIQYRLERAGETLHDAQLLFDNDGSPASVVNRAFDYRQIGDYRELLNKDKKQAEEILSSAAQFVETVKTYLQNKK